MGLTRDRFEYILLSTMLFLVFFRTSGIGIGYPNVESQLGSASYLPQKLAQALILGLIIVYVYIYPKCLQALRFNSVSLMLLGLAIVLSIVLSHYKGLSVRYLLSFVVVILPLCFYRARFGINAMVHNFSVFVFLVLICSFIYALLLPQYGIMAANHAGALRGLFLHKNVFGFFCVLTSLFCLYYIISKNASNNKLYAFIYFLSFIGVAKSQSTTSLVLFGLGLICFVFFTFILSLSNPKVRVILYYLFLVIVFVSTFTFSVYFEQITYALGKDPTLTGRTELWEILFYVGMDKPLFGHGLGLFSRPEIMHQFSLDFGWEAKSAHNSFLDVFLGIGFVGLFAFLSLVLTNIFKFPFSHYASANRVLSASGIVTILCFGFSESGAFMGVGFIWLTFIIFLFLSSNTSFSRNQLNQH
ncbi:O-antigen ligase family protein [Shewanella japonica]|uniref:O-antigen ligase family protein n=1 Tax=Shewanella japonica TaxID=93973 RepID=UPI002494FC40|nr:O-antigen ligase family protein [Shewanella japonica]